MTAIDTGVVSGGGHLDDGQLLAILDVASGDRVVADGHLRECAVCRSRLDVITKASGQFATAIHSMPLPAVNPRVRRSIVKHARLRRPTSRWAAYPMVAAATILLLASAALASPVRQWIVRHLTDQQAAPTPPTPPSPSSVAPVGVPRTGMTVSFAPSDTVLAVVVSARQSAGVLEVVSSTGASISARITAGGVDEEFLIAPGTLQIRNDAASRADYRVEVPSQIRAVRVRIGTGFERTVVVGAGAHQSISLAGQLR